MSKTDLKWVTKNSTEIQQNTALCLGRYEFPLNVGIPSAFLWRVFGLLLSEAEVTP